MRGYFRIRLDGNDRTQKASRRTGEARLMEVEKALRQKDIPFVEDFDKDNTVIVRYGDYTDDIIFEARD